MTDDWNHRVKVRLLPRDLLRALGAPDSVDLRRVVVTDDPEAVWLIVEHPSLERVHPAAEAPVMDANQAEAAFSEIAAFDAYQ